MKKHIITALLLTLTLLLCGCSKNTPQNQTENETDPPATSVADESKELAQIIIHDVPNGTPGDAVEEVFFEDEKYVFSFAYPKSSYIIVGCHKSAYPAGPYVSDGKYFMSLWGAIFDECQVDLVLSGHDHVFTRTKNILYIC